MLSSVIISETEKKRKGNGGREEGKGGRKEIREGETRGGGKKEKLSEK